MIYSLSSHFWFYLIFLNSNIKYIIFIYTYAIIIIPHYNTYYSTLLFHIIIIIPNFVKGKAQHNTTHPDIWRSWIMILFCLNRISKISCIFVSHELLQNIAENLWKTVKNMTDFIESFFVFLWTLYFITLVSSGNFGRQNFSDFLVSYGSKIFPIFQKLFMDRIFSCI